MGATASWVAHRAFPSFRPLKYSFPHSFSSPLQFMELRDVAPAVGYTSRSGTVHKREDVLSYLIRKHKGSREALQADIDAWHGGALDLELWEPAAKSKDKQPAKKVRLSLCCCCGVVCRAHARIESRCGRLNLNHALRAREATPSSVI